MFDVLSMSSENGSGLDSIRAMLRKQMEAGSDA